MKLWRLAAAPMLFAACASTPQPPAATATAADQPAATRQTTAAVDPVGSYEFATSVDGQPLTGKIHIEGTPANYKGRIVTSMFPDIPITRASAEANVIYATATMPDGDVVIRMFMDGMNFTGSWTLGTETGELSGKKLPQ
jgi:hypothetical protein